MGEYMRENIRKLFSIMKSSNVPRGFKRIDFGIVSKDFEELKISDWGEFKNGINFSREEGKHSIKFLGVGNFGDKTILDNAENLENIYVFMSDEKLEPYLLKNDDIVFVRSNGSKELVGRNLLIHNLSEKVIYSGFCIRYRLNADCKKTSTRYINAWLDNGVLKKLLKKENRGTNISNLNQEILSKLRIYVPEISEQEKILEVIENYNKLLYQMELFIDCKYRQKCWLMQNLLTGKKRISGFHSEWKKVKVGNFIKEINERSTINNEHNVLSVTKTGICLQSEHFNKQIASEDNIGYKVVRRGNLVFSTMNLWMGSLDVLKEYDVGIVSPAYKVFEFNPKYMLTQFGNFFMKTEHMIWIYNINSEQGASVVRKNLDLEGLLNYIVAIPDIQEQRAIAKFLETADREIELLEKKLELIKQEKKAMMQLLLTGIVRVNKS